MLTTPSSSEASVSTAAVAPSGRARSAMAAVLLGLVLVASACSSGPGSREELVEVLSADGSITEEQASCVADAIFDEYEEQGDALGLISSAESFDALDSADGVPGFGEFLRQTVESCVAFGPAG